MKKRGALIFYVGNGVVKAAVVQKENVTRPHVIATERRELSYADARDRNHLETRIVSELNQLCLDLKTHILTKPECQHIAVQEAVIIYSSPWYISQTKNVKIAQEKPFVVTEQLVQAAIEESGQPYMRKANREFTILEQKLIKTTLNGYPTDNPFKKKASAVELTVFLSFARNESLAKVRDTIEKHFHFHTVSEHSQSLASFTVIEKVWPECKNYVLTDITSELTELLIVRQHTLSEAASFPQGGRFVLQELSNKLSTTGEVSASLLKLYDEKKLDAALQEKMTTGLSDIKKQWLQSFTKALTDMSAHGSLPSKFFLFTPKEFSWLFSDFIKGEEYQQFSFSEGKFEVYDVKVTDISDHCTWNAETEQDLSMAIGALFNFYF